MSAMADHLPTHTAACTARCTSEASVEDGIVTGRATATCCETRLNRDAGERDIERALTRHIIGFLIKLDARFCFAVCQSGNKPTPGGISGGISALTIRATRSHQTIATIFPFRSRHQNSLSTIDFTMVSPSSGVTLEFSPKAPHKSRAQPRGANELGRV